MTHVFIIIAVLSVLLLGALVSLPPVRRLGRRSLTTRAPMVLTLSLISFLASLGLLTFSDAVLEQVIVDDLGSVAFGVEVAEQMRQHSGPILRELWLRQMGPPPLQHACYTSAPLICELTDHLIRADDWHAYGQKIGLGLAFAGATFLLAWLYTRP